MASVLAAELEKNRLLFGTQIIDGTAVGPGARVLLTAQTDPTENGVWIVQQGAWTRPVEFFREIEEAVEVTFGSDNVGLVFGTQTKKPPRGQSRLAATAVLPDIPTFGGTFNITQFTTEEELKLFEDKISGVPDKIRDFTETQEEDGTFTVTGLSVIDLSTQVDGERVEFDLPTVLFSDGVILTLNGLVMKNGADGDYLITIDGSQVKFQEAPQLTDIVLLYHL